MPFFQDMFTTRILQEQCFTFEVLTKILQEIKYLEESNKEYISCETPVENTLVILMVH